MRCPPQAEPADQWTEKGMESLFHQRKETDHPNTGATEKKKKFPTAEKNQDKCQEGGKRGYDAERVRKRGNSPAEREG